jgi:hypothetical protein
MNYASEFEMDYAREARELHLASCRKQIADATEKLRSCMGGVDPIGAVAAARELMGRCRPRH